MRGKQRLSSLWGWVKSSRFEIEAKAHASVLPVLSRQLQETIGSIENGTKDVCSSFGQMASLARGAADMGAALVQDNGSPTVNDAIQDCRVMLSQLSDRLERSGDLYAKAIDQMENANNSVHRVFQALGELDKASFASRIVALNAKIEAVHLGQLGSGFEVVAEQISAQAARSAELTASIVDILNDLNQTTNAATTELKDLAAADKTAADLSRKDAEQTLIKLEHASTRMQDTVSETRKTSETLYAEISKAIVSMQFQDRVSQRLAHVIDSLDAMNRALAEAEKSAPDVALAVRKQQVADELAATYTMSSERHAHEQNAAPGGLADGSDSSGDIELF